MHCRVAQVMCNHAMYGNRTHLYMRSRWKPAGGGDHGALVFWRLCGVLWLCVGRWLSVSVVTL